MKAAFYILVGFGISLVFISAAYFFIFCSYRGGIKAITSSPVEEMYHRQLVITLDSILDARFSSGCCEEDIDSDDINVPPTLFSNHLDIELMK